jgi:hypothetical protein
MGRTFAAAAHAFEATLDSLDLGAGDDLPDGAELGRRAALLAVADVVWRRHLGLVLEGDEVRAVLGVRTRQAVHDLVKRRRLLALPGPEGRLVYPAFQFASDGRPHPALVKILPLFADAGVTAHTVGSWFRAPQGLLAGATPAAWLEEGRDSAVLVEAARRSAARLGR